MSSFRRVLVANRGEIAVRVMRTCRERGLETVAVFSEADRLAPHVLMADRAVCVGPPPAAQSYLDIDRILRACRDTGADAVHPGYGFLSENAEFADACARAGVTFVGPPAAAIRAMGSKTAARAAMAAAGVPVVPGDNGPDGRGFPSTEAALEAARAIGFPVLLKASAGGGGKGMRLVADETAFAAAFDGARREAVAAFGDEAVYIEKAIERPRHVEIQVFADDHGNVVHLGERDCSIQRRHQKVIEEAPSPAVDAGLRARMGDVAVRAARAVNYVGAGTVEFLLAADGSFYFLEMNTRLQVEHPVTELLYGVDLVAWQLDVAAGGRLPMAQAEIDAARRGAAIECRIYAEDPRRFLPSPGTITRLRVPSGPYVRNDAGVYEGSEITAHYDPMISKLIVWGRDRAEAVARMRRALDEYAVGGIDTNLAFHRRCVRHPEFVAGRYDTGFIDREAEALCGPTAADGPLLDVALAAAAIDAHPAHGVASRAIPGDGRPAAGAIPAWRLAGSRWP
ncbi:MAG: acetyl-CoA carboxylase biotin carboxylase subunit [Deltaproteobacteria bacterium]|nr:MAG: acetyl-CoA carboxylase biotin carboxylase subunit [Deltaproteobacteria bacterium]